MGSAFVDPPDDHGQAQTTIDENEVVDSAVTLIFRQNQSPQVLYEADSECDGDGLF